MSFLCNVAAGQHTPKSILESSEPRNVTLAAALGTARESSGGLGRTVENCGELRRTVENCGELGDIYNRDAEGGGAARQSWRGRAVSRAVALFRTFLALRRLPRRSRRPGRRPRLQWCPYGGRRPGRAQPAVANCWPAETTKCGRGPTLGDTDDPLETIKRDAIRQSWSKAGGRAGWRKAPNYSILGPPARPVLNSTCAAQTGRRGAVGGRLWASIREAPPSVSRSGNQGVQRGAPAGATKTS